MSQGLKNLQTAARSCARRERMLDTSNPHSYTYGERDDSGIGCDDLDDMSGGNGADYDAASDRSGSAGVYQAGHHYSSSAGSSGYGHPHGGRLPSMDNMGIDSIINRPR